MAFAARADAHAVLESSSPAAGEVVAPGRATSVVELRFDEPVEVSLGSVRVLAATGRRVDLGGVYHPGGRSSRVAVGLRSGLAEGSYLVLWRVVSADSHPVAGSFTFSLGHVGPVATGTADSPGRGVPVALGINRFVGYAGLVALLGGVVFLLVCWPAGWEMTSARVVVWFGLIAAAVSTLAGLVVQGAADVGAGLSGVTDLAPVWALVSTRFGHAHLARLGLLAAIAVMLLALPAMGAVRPPGVQAHPGTGQLIGRWTVRTTLDEPPVDITGTLSWLPEKSGIDKSLLFLIGDALLLGAAVAGFALYRRHRTGHAVQQPPSTPELDPPAGQPDLLDRRELSTLAARRQYASPSNGNTPTRATHLPQM